MLDREGLLEEYAELYEPASTNGEAIERLARIIKILRKLCPWDKVQTHESLRRCMIEEAYEVVDAVDRNDKDNLREELGDVMLQVVMHAEIASENESFDLVDAINDECDKMIRRHPHIFSTFSAKTVDKVLEKWENVKSKEHGNIKQTQRLTDVPRALPALIRSEKVQKRAAEVGFDWDDIEEPLKKVQEEFAEFCEAREEHDTGSMMDELGDLLFSVVNVARFADIDPEEALNAATDKFIKRFGMLESKAESLGKRLQDMSLSEMDAVWNEIKH